MNDSVFRSIQLSPGRAYASCDCCGQILDAGKGRCEMCERQEMGIVLAVLRHLILMKGDYKRDQTEENQKNNTREMMVAASLDRFPGELIERIRKYPHLAKTAGVWFAHLCAYLNAKYIHGSDLSPKELGETPTYLALRGQLFRLMAKDGDELNEEALDMLFDIYCIPNASLDARSVIFQNMLSLERRQLLQIERPMDECKACGGEVPLGIDFCEDCRKDEKLAMMKAIENQHVVSLLNPVQPTLRKTRGMHTRKA